MTQIKSSFLIHCLTDLHAGQGDSTDGPVDKMIQRDATSLLPAIFGSSLKGALRDFAVFQNEPNVKTFYGSDKNDGSSTQGLVNFLDAQILTFPLPSNKKQWFYAISPEHAKLILEFCANFAFTLADDLKSDLTQIQSLIVGENIPKCVNFPGTTNLRIHDFDSFTNETKTLQWNQWKDNLVVLNHNDFKMVCDNYNLPIIARNNLQGTGNLWYEQFVPNQTFFLGYFIDNSDKKFADSIKDKVIQIGANATVGQGFCKFTII